MISLSLADVTVFLLLAARWTLLLSAIAFVGGAVGATLLLLWRYGAPKTGQRATTIYIQFFQGTPLLLQLFLIFFGLPMLGIEVSPLLAAGVALTLYASAFPGRDLARLRRCDPKGPVGCQRQPRHEVCHPDAPCHPAASTADRGAANRRISCAAD